MLIINHGMKNTLYLLIGILLCTLSACEKEDQYTRDPYRNFEALWQILDKNYCFFEYKDVDWNEVYDKYAVQMSDTMSNDSLFNKLGDMLSELKDGHTNLYSSFNVARYWKWYEDYPDNFNEMVHRHYMGTDYRIAGGIKYMKLTPDIGYIYYGSFMSPVGDSNLDYILMYFADCKGLIIDVRNNGGGNLTMSDRIASRFAKEKLVCGYIKHKSGPGHNDFSNPYPIELTPSDRVRWFRPVAVLTNRRCYSATNDFVNKMRLFPQVIQIGDKTGGGSGFPFSSELPNGWSVRFSSSPILDAKMRITEFGIDPDISVTMTQADVMSMTDPIIDRAVRYITENAPEVQKPTILHNTLSDSLRIQ